jgi:hypothetical protein
MGARTTDRAGGESHARAGVVALCVLLLAAPARAAAPPEVTLDDAKEGCRVRGVFDTPATLAPIVWDVLTDYDHIGTFVRSMRASRVEKRDSKGILVRQDAVGGVFLFRRRVQVLLDVHEEPGRRIAFRDVLGKDFREYVGEWRIAADSTGTHVTYQLQAEPKMPMPRSVCRGMLKHVARDLLQEVRDEILRRGAAGERAETHTGSTD